MLPAADPPQVAGRTEESMGTVRSFWSNMLGATMNVPASVMRSSGTVGKSSMNASVHHTTTWQRRFIDRWFYNVSDKDFNEVDGWGPLPQGAVIHVPADAKMPVRWFPDAAAFLAHPLHETTGALSIAGLGSSAVGAVGLARDVATGTGVAVAAIAAGFGVDDLLNQAI